MKLKTNREKKAFRSGIGVGAANKPKTKVKKTKPANKGKIKIATKSKQVKRRIEPKYLGSTYVNGKFYDTNFKKPVEITKSKIKDLRREYDVDGKRTDSEIVNSYVHHMRRKYGSFDENGKFLGLLGD